MDNDDESIQSEDEEYVEDEMSEDDYVEEQEYISEIKAGERTGGIIIPSGGLKTTTNPVEQFKIIVSAIFQSTKEHFKLGQKDLSAINDKISYIKNIQYKNPIAYVLGYIGSKGGTELTEESVKRAIKYLESSRTTLGEKSYHVTEPDVVRYSVFWQNLSSRY